MPMSKEAQRICTLGGVARLNGKLVEFQDLERTLEIAIADVNKAAKDEYFWRAMEVSAKLVQVSCDLTIAILEEAADKVGASAGAKGVSLVYDIGKITANAFAMKMTVKDPFILSTNAKVDAIADMLSQRGSKYGKVLSRTKVLVNLSIDLYDYWKDGGEQTLTGSSGLAGARRTAVGQLMRIRRQIGETRAALQACELVAPSRP